MQTLKRRQFLQTLGAASAAIAMPQAAALAAPARKKPNIVFIMVDDMGYADLGCFGSKVVKTPRIDKMAKEGMKFTDFYSGCTVCAPARSTLMTGMHMGHTSVRSNAGGVPLLDSDVTIAEMLKKQGYATGGFGKWGIGDIGTDGAAEKQGFDHFFGYYHQIHAHNYYPEYLIRDGKKETLPGNANGQKKQHSHYLVAEETRKFIRENKDRPFFCYAPWTLPHGGYVLPKDDPAHELYKDKEWKANAKIAAAMDSIIDRHVGELLDLLKELEIDDNTIVFFCSDNGAALRFESELDSSGPLRGQKRDMYEGGIRVPMIVRWPGKVNPGTTNKMPGYFPDMFPTFLDLVGAKKSIPENVDGISLRRTLLTGKPPKNQRILYWEWHFYDWSTNDFQVGGLMQAVRDGNWKMLRHKNAAPWELYDLSQDIGEKNNIAAKHPDVVERLANWIKKNRTDARHQPEPEMPEGKKFR